MKVSYLTDSQVREEYLKLLTRIESSFYNADPEDYESTLKLFWNELGYSNGEIPDY